MNLVANSSKVELSQMAGNERDWQVDSACRIRKTLHYMLCVLVTCVPVSRFEFTDESSAYWPIIGLGPRDC